MHEKQIQPVESESHQEVAKVIPLHPERSSLQLVPEGFQQLISLSERRVHENSHVVDMNERMLDLLGEAHEELRALRHELRTSEAREAKLLEQRRQLVHELQRTSRHATKIKELLQAQQEYFDGEIEARERELVRTRSKLDAAIAQGFDLLRHKWLSRSNKHTAKVRFEALEVSR